CHRHGWWMSNGRYGAPAQNERYYERADAVCSNAAVAHDLELIGDGLAAAETVGGIGKAIFVQAAGCDQSRSKCQAGGERSRQSQAKGNPVDQRAGGSDERACDRKCPARARNVFAGDWLGMGKRQPGAENDADLEVGCKAVEQSVRRIHGCIPECWSFWA